MSIIWENKKIYIVDIATTCYNGGRGGKIADYKAMYLAAMDAMERAVRLLTEAQQKCEDLYVETSDREPVVLSWEQNEIGKN